MISVIVPVYNGEKTIERCLRSILNNVENEENVEIVVVDDGSKDNTYDICNIMEKEDCKIKVFRKQNGGVSSAREYGISKSTGEWIMFVDSDDIISCNFFKYINEDSLSNADWVIFSQYFEDNNVRIDVNNQYDEILKGILNVDKESIYNKIHTNTVWSKLYKKEIIEKNNICFQKSIFHGEDMLYNIEYLSKCKKILGINQSIYTLVNNSESATHKFQDKMIENDIEFLEKIEEYILNINEEDNEEIYFKIVLNGMWSCLNQYFFNKDNKKSLRQKRSELKRFVCTEPYNTALKELNKIKVLFKRKVIFFLLSKRFYFLLLFIFSILTKKKSKIITNNSEINI